MSVAEELFARHREMLEAAVAATRSREYYSAYPESPSPKVYGESAAADGLAAFDSWLGHDVRTSADPGCTRQVVAPRSHRSGSLWTCRIRG